MERLIEVAERVAGGIERLAEDPIVEIEAGPPTCPHCQKFNPEVEVRETQGSGPLFEFFITAICLECRQTFYVLPLQYSTHPNIESLTQEINERGGNSNGRS